MTLNCNSHDTLKPVSNIQTSLDCYVFIIIVIIIIITIAIIIIKHTWNENSYVSIEHINLYKFWSHRLHYQVHINTNRKLFARID